MYKMFTAVGNGLKPFPTKYNDRIIIGNGLKPFPTRMPLRIHPSERFKWQKSFYDHIIRDFKSLEKIRNYIYTNPVHWEKDIFFNNK